MMALPGPPAERWDGLAAAAGNLFGTRDWAECWWEHYGAGCSPLVLSEDGDDGAPRVLLPLYVSGGALRQVRFLGNGPADQLGPLCAPEDNATAAAALRTLRGAPDLRWDVLLAQNVRESDGWDTALGGVVVGRVDSPVVRLGEDDWDRFLSTRSKNFREQVRRRERKLRAAYDVQVRLATADTLAADLATLFRLHQERWGADAPFATGVERRFHEDFAPAALGRDRLRLWVMELDGVPVAVLHGFRFAGVEVFHQSGRDPSYEKESVGFVLLVHAIRAALQDGMTEYRLLRGDEAYKSRFADANDGVHTVAVARGLKGRAAVEVARRRRSA